MNKEEKLMRLLAPFLDTPEADPFLKELGCTRKNFHRFIYKNTPQILAHPKECGFPADLCAKVEVLAASNLEPTIPWGKNVTFNKSTKVLSVVVPSLRCVSVHKRDDQEPESVTTDFIGGHMLELDLSHKGDKAYISSSKGEVEIKIKDSKIESNRVLIGKSGKKGIAVGDVYEELADGKDFYMSVNDLSAKERLVNFLSYPKLPSYKEYLGKGRDDDITCDYLVSIMKTIAKEQKLYPKIDYMEDMAALKKRLDFAYDKDFRHIYDDSIHPAIQERSRILGR